MSWPTPLLALLQSNDAVAEAVRRGAEGAKGLAVVEHSYGGMTGGFALIFLKLIEFWDLLFHSYGLAIIVTVLTIRLVVFPLTRMQIRSMKVMQYITPVQKVVARYYPNRQDQNSKMMELYQEYKINPMAGCLPLVIQMPILFGVYRALYDPTFAGHSFLGVQLLFPVSLTTARTMGHGPDIGELIDVTVATLGLHGQILSIPVNVPFIGGQFIYWPALVLVLLYGASSWFLQRVMKKVNAPHPEFEAELKAEFKGKDDEHQPPDFAAQMQRQMGLMNVMIVVMALFFSAGALIYFVVQNVVMALEYTLFSRGAEPAFNVADMKAFIRRPPPPLPQLKGGADRGDAGRNGKEDKALTSKSQGAEPDLPRSNGEGGPQQSRRKRRKR